MGNIFTSIQYGTCDICPGPVFRWEFNGGVHFVIRLTIFGNFFVLYVCICIIHHFSVWIQPWQWLCHLETKFLKYMIWSSSGIIFQWIQPWWWLCHLETIFLKYMIWSSSGIIFQCKFSRDSDYVIWRLYFKIHNIVINRHHFSFHKIQDQKACQINVKKAHLRQCQGQHSG